MPHSKTFATLALLITCSLPSWAEAGLVCDINDDSFVDINDIRTIILNRNQPATGPDDPMDLDQNGVISILDARGCVLACSLPRCAEAPVTNTNPTVSLDIKTFRFSWADVPNATHYRLLENPDGISGFSQAGGDIPQGTGSFDHIVPLYKRINASYIFQTCFGSVCADSDTIYVVSTLVGAIGYLKASNTGPSDSFGWSATLSGDGKTLAVVAISEDSNATGINGNQDDNSAAFAGAVYVFTRSGTTWSQQAYVKASNTDAGDRFGIAVSLSGDGNILAIGAHGEGSNATGINGDQADNSAIAAGAVYVFTRSGTTWSQQAYVKASNTDAGDFFGFSVSLSGDGNTLVVGSGWEDSNATGINGNQADNSASLSGAVYVFTRSGTTWDQQAYVKASNTREGNAFGGTVGLSGDGNTLAVGATEEAGGATGINGDQDNNSRSSAGAVYVYTRNGTDWSQQAYVKASNTGFADRFGGSVALSIDGNTLAVVAATERSNATGINGDQSDNSAPNAGAAYVFARSDTTWVQQAYLKASNTDAFDRFGDSVALSSDGNSLAISARLEDSNATGINGDQTDNSTPDAGAVYFFRRSGTTWSQQAYVKAGNTNANDEFGVRIGLSGDGNTLAVGARGEDSNVTGINGNQADNSAPSAGAVYLY